MLIPYSLALLALLRLPDAVAGSGPVVDTTSGSYVGVQDTQNEVDVFLGIPFASASARFMPALPVSNVQEGPQNADAFGADCPQFASPFGEAGVLAGPPLRGANQSEDCFFLNVWRPAGTSAAERLPILVDIYGGGYFSGSGSEWNGTNLVRRSVATNKPFIYINFNYRTGVFGFIGSAQAPLSALNVGLQDQRDALRWIQDNAATFGGDASLVTITGESAGGASVHLHYLYPDSRATFRAGITSSGTALVTNAPACEWHDRPGGAYNVLGNITGCGTGTGSFQCLQNIPFDTFLPLALSTYQSPGSALPPWAICVGPQGSLLDEYPVKKVLTGDFLQLPIVTGSNRNEGNFIIGTDFLDMSPQPNSTEENALLSAFIGGHATNSKTVPNATLEALLALYADPTDNLATNSSLYNRAAQFETDFTFLAPNRLFLETASTKQDVWAYSFQQPVPGTPDVFGAFHTSDLYYLDVGFAIVPTGEIVTQLQDFYISFTNDLNPGTSWPKYTEETKLAMRFLDGAVGPIADTVRRNQTDFLNQVDVMEEFGRFG
ncbi:alpha/beta-hydrolase [Mycena vitilis]|nr:alpha/beta-hydrolase [Mycena vitilis]